MAFSCPTEEYRGDDVRAILKKVNTIRANGCFCGNQYYPPAGSVRWSKTLHVSALKHAKDMTRNNYFSHFSPRGKDVGDRLDALGYKWLYVGENLGEGQRTLDEVLLEWKRSPSHCQMLMNPNMSRMGLAHHGRFWVQHFAKPLPKNAVKRGSKYYIPRER